MLCGHSRTATGDKHDRADGSTGAQTSIMCVAMVSSIHQALWHAHSSGCRHSFEQSVRRRTSAQRRLNRDEGADGEDEVVDKVVGRLRVQQAAHHLRRLRRVHLHDKSEVLSGHDITQQGRGSRTLLRPKE